jgi:succinoglycan biosynthesis transport protein ExoP
MVNAHPNQNPAMQPTSMLNFVSILFKRKKIILSFFFSVVLIVTIFSFIQSPIFQASSKLLLERDVDSEKSLLFRMTLTEPKSDDWLNSEIEILNSYPVAAKVVETLGLDQPEEKEPDLTQDEKTTKQQQTIRLFQKKLVVENLPKSNVLEVSYESKDPELAAAAVNNVIEVYIGHRSEISNESDTYKFFEEQMHIADERLRDLEKSQAEYRQKEEVISPEGQNEILMSRLSDYEKSFTEVRTKRIGKEAKLAVIKQQLEKSGEISIPSTESSDSPSRVEYISKLKSDLLEMEMERERLLQKFTPKYQEIVNLENEIAATKKKIENEIHQIVEMEDASIRALKAEENALRSSINQIKGELKKLTQKEYEYAQISRGIDDNREVYSMLLKQREEARISLAKLEKGVKIKIISPAVVPTDPVKPKKRVNILLGIFLGIFGGLGLAFFIEYFDHTITTPAELEKYTGMNVLGSVRETSELVANGNGF